MVFDVRLSRPMQVLLIVMWLAPVAAGCSVDSPADDPDDAGADKSSPCLELELSNHGESCEQDMMIRACEFQARCITTDEILTLRCDCATDFWDCHTAHCELNGESALEPLPECREGIDLSYDGKACDGIRGCDFDAVCKSTGEVVPSACLCVSDGVWQCRSGLCEDLEGELEPLE